MNTVWLLISPVVWLVNSAVTNSGARVRHVLVLALLDRGLDLVEARVGEGQRHRAGEVLDRGDLVEDLLETARRVLVTGVDAALEPRLVAGQPLEGLDLQVEQVGRLERLVDLRERDPLRRSRESPTWSWSQQWPWSRERSPRCVLPGTNSWLAAELARLSRVRRCSTNPRSRRRASGKMGSAKGQSSHAHGDCREAPGRTLLLLTDRVTLHERAVKMSSADHSLDGASPLPRVTSFDLHKHVCGAVLVGSWRLQADSQSATRICVTEITRVGTGGRRLTRFQGTSSGLRRSVILGDVDQHRSPGKRRLRVRSPWQSRPFWSPACAEHLHVVDLPPAVRRRAPTRSMRCRRWSGCRWCGW